MGFFPRIIVKKRERAFPEIINTVLFALPEGSHDFLAGIQEPEKEILALLQKIRGDDYNFGG